MLLLLLYRAILSCAEPEKSFYRGNVTIQYFSWQSTLDGCEKVAFYKIGNHTANEKIHWKYSHLSHVCHRMDQTSSQRWSGFALSYDPVPKAGLFFTTSISIEKLKVETRVNYYNNGIMEKLVTCIEISLEEPSWWSNDTFFNMGNWWHLYVTEHDLKSVNKLTKGI